MTGRCEADRVAYALTLDLSHGPHGATARIELLERDTEDGGSARLALFGWIDRLALVRLETPLAELAERGVRRLRLDCSRVRHIEFAALPALTTLLAHSFREPGALHLIGLSPHLRDLFRNAGCGWEAPLPVPAGTGAMLALSGLAREWAT